MEEGLKNPPEDDQRQSYNAKSEINASVANGKAEILLKYFLKQERNALCSQTEKKM